MLPHTTISWSSSLKCLSTLDTQCALNWIESCLSVSTLNVHLSDLDPIWINPNPLPEVVLIRTDLDHAIVHCMWGPKKDVACTRVLTIDSEHASLGYTLTVFHVSAQLKKQYDGWLKYRSDEGAMVAVWRCGHLKSTCTCEFVPHNAVWGCDQCALDSHWIRIRQFSYWIRITVTWSFTAGMMQCLAPS